LAGRRADVPTDGNRKKEETHLDSHEYVPYSLGLQQDWGA
jgi:hypothetical protein